MPIKAFEQIDAGGVDSRSNPINLPRNRALRCLNWVPKQAGFWELRWGYSSVTMSTVSASAIHSMFPYRTWNGTKYVLFMQGTTLNLLNTSTNIVTTPTVLGAAVASSVKGMGYFANNRFHYGNGTDQKWFDGTNWRDNGLPDLVGAALSSYANASTGFSEGVRELTSAQASTITLTAAGGGSFPGDVASGHLMYVVLFHPALNEVGPATISVGSGRIVVPASDKITVANMPNLTGVGDGDWVKLIAGTPDGGNVAYFFTNTSTNIVSIVKSGLGYPFTLTVTATAHGLSSGDVVVIAGTTSNDGIYSVLASGLTVNVFTVTRYLGSLSGVSQGANTGAIGTVKRIVQAPLATTSVDVLANTQDTSYQANQNLGFAASTIGGANPGYQFYMSLYNPNGGGHIGNRYLVGPRFVQTGYRTNIRITAIPQAWNLNSEWAVLIGRTVDGGSTPYACTDNVSNLTAYVAINASPFLVILTAANISPLEMPTRNGIIPSQCNMFCVAGDYVYAADTGSPYLRRSGDMSQAVERGNTVLGRPEQSWAANDIDTFPTAEAMTGIFEVDQEVFCGTLHDSAISANLAGIQQWVGPWAVGIAGRRAGTKCGSWGFYWVSGDKQLCTLSQGVPVGVSDEYELAELAQIGDAQLSTTELVYYRNVAQNKDELRIEGQKSDGTPYTIIHDFKLREVYSAPLSLYGQGYSSQFQGPLNTAFTSALVRDSNGKLQIYSGASNGQLYQLYTGADDVGNQYTADLILLVNGGPDRPDVPWIDWYGDGNIDVQAGKTLNSSLTPGAEFNFEDLTPASNPAQAVQGAENDFLFRAYFDRPELQHAYLRFLLTSHSADGNLSLNNPVHLPLENYGRIYELIPAIGDERQR